MSPIKLVKIRYDDIEANPRDYNSFFHTTEPQVLRLSTPSEAPQKYSRWLALIAASQGISLPSVQTVSLSHAQARLILTASNSSIITRRMNLAYEEELLSDVAPALAGLVFPPEGLFLRLDAASAKDGVGAALRTVPDVLLKLTTSGRAQSAIRRLVEEEEEEEDGRRPGGPGAGPGEEAQVKLHFMPFDPAMDTLLEYRVFCAPPAGAITAVSQYSLRRSYYASRPDDELRSIMSKVMEGIRHIHALILTEARTGKAGELDTLLLEQGFSFDVMWQEAKQRCVLIELNGFGARGGTGTSLFHWIRDFDVLYGRRTGEGVEFRICV